MGRLVTEPLLKLLDKFLVPYATSYRVSGETSGVWVGMYIRLYGSGLEVGDGLVEGSKDGVRKICSHNGGSGQEVCGLSILVILARRGQIMEITTACAILVQPPFHAQSSWRSAAPLPVPAVDEGGMGSYRHAISLTASDLRETVGVMGAHREDVYENVWCNVARLNSNGQAIEYRDRAGQKRNDAEVDGWCERRCTIRDSDRGQSPSIAPDLRETRYVRCFSSRTGCRSKRRGRSKRGESVLPS